MSSRPDNDNVEKLNHGAVSPPFALNSELGVPPFSLIKQLKAGDKPRARARPPPSTSPTSTVQIGMSSWNFSLSCTTWPCTLSIALLQAAIETTFNFTAPAAFVKKEHAAQAQEEVDDQPFFEMDPL